jgi:hypothetical protein
MALVTPPSWLQAGSYPAESDRLNAQALYATTGIIGSASMAITPNSPAGMSVRVATGWAAVVGTTQPNMGVYTAFNDATTVLTVTTADPTNPRIDRVVMTIRDAYYTGAFNDVIYQVLAGTPAGSPTAPATPANSISLATIAVGAGVTSIIAANITDTRPEVTTNLPAPGLNFSVNTQTGTTYTTVFADNGKLITQANASPITTTIAPNSSVDYPVGAQITFAQYGAGQVTIQGGSGVTVVSTGATAATPKLRVQYSTATAIQTSNDNWLVVGDIS